MKPRTLLVFLLLLVPLLVVCLVCEELSWHWGYDPTKGSSVAFFGLDRQGWGVVITAAAAVCGWICTSLVAIQNSVKQHTVNTLLQSRLSVKFLENGDKINTLLIRDGVRKPLSTADCNDPARFGELEALRYMLNYYEFIAVGVRQGDLHEPLLKHTIRGIVCGLTITTRKYIELSREAEHARLAQLKDYEVQREGPRTYRNLLWLYHKWKDPSDPHID